MKLVRFCLAGVLFAYLFLSAFYPVETEDVWWHLSTGRYIVTQQQAPTVDLFPFNSEKTNWTYTQWLGDGVLYLIQQAGGFDGLKVFRALMVVGVFVLFFYAFVRKLPYLLLVFLIFCMSFGVDLRSYLRPDLFNYWFILIILLILSAYERTRRGWYLLLIPFLGGLWFNLHLGSFVYGSILLLVFLLFLSLQYYNDLRRDGPGKTTKKDIIFVALAVVGFYLSFLANPYGWQGFSYPWRVFGDPGFIGFYQFNSFISEQQPPGFILTSKGFWVWSLLLLYVLSCMKNKQKKMWEIVLFCFSFFMFLYSVRGSAFFVLVSGYCIASNWTIRSEAQAENSRKQCFLQGICGLILFLLLLANIIRTINKGYEINGHFVRRIDLQEDVFSPRLTLDALLAAGVKGRVFNFDRYGGYILWHGYPQLRPFVDGRQLNKEHWKAYQLIVSDPEKYWPLFSAQYDFQLALINSKEAYSYQLLRYLVGAEDWQIVKIDGFSVLFVKRGAFHLPAEWKNFETHLHAPPADPVLPPPPAVSKDDSKFQWLKEFLCPPSIFDKQLEEVVTLYDLGFKSTAISALRRMYEDKKSEKVFFILQSIQQAQ